MPTATSGGPSPSAAERSSGDQKETEEDFKRVPPEPLARGGFVAVLTFGLQSEAEREGGQTFPRKYDVFEALTRFHSPGISFCLSLTSGCCCCRRRLRTPQKQIKILENCLFD